MRKQNERIALSREETALAVGVSLSQVNREIKRGRLEVARIGGRVVIPKQSIAKWLGLPSVDEPEGLPLAS